MRTARVLQASRLSEMPGQDAGAQAVIRVLTDIPSGYPKDTPNAFYMDLVDFDGAAVKLPMANQPDGAPKDPEALNNGDEVLFDIQAGFHKRVSWNGRGFRQHGYSFDWLAPAQA